MNQTTTLGVLFRWLRVKAAVQEQAQAARMAVVAKQLAEVRGTYPEQARVAA